MALNAESMKNALLAATQGATDPSAMGTAIADTLVADMELDFAWAARNNDNVPDPATATTGNLLSCTIVFTHTGTMSHSASMQMLSNWILTGVSAATFNITASGFSCAPVVFGPPPTPLVLTAPALDMQGDIRDQLFLNIANKIITWITAYVPAAPSSGTHGEFTGAGVCTAVK